MIPIKKTRKQCICREKRCIPGVSRPKIAKARIYEDKSITKGEEHCIIYLNVLAFESMKPSKLKRYFDSKHSESAKKPTEFFVKKQRKLNEHVFFNGAEEVKQQVCQQPIVTTNGGDIVLTEVVNIVYFIWQTNGLTTEKHFLSK